MSRKDDLINSYGGVNGIMAQTPDAKARIRNELLEAARQDAIDANRQAEKQAQGSIGQDLAGVGGSVAGIVGGSYLGNQIFGGGSAAASTASGAGAAGGAVGGTATGALPAAPVGLMQTPGLATAGSGTGAATGGGMLAGNGALATYGVPAAVAAGTYLAGKSLYDTFQGKEDKSPQGLFGRAQAAFSTGGLSEAAKLFGIGHSKRYFEGEDRKNFANNVNKQFGPGAMNAEQFDNDPGSWSYDLKSEGVKKELGAGQALSYLLGSGAVGSKMFTDASSRFANDVKGGANVKDMFAKYGFDYNKAMQALGGDSGLSAEQKAALQNGLNDAFGPQSGSSQGSPGRRPQNSSSQTRTPKQKAKQTSDALSKLWK